MEIAIDESSSNEMLEALVRGPSEEMDESIQSSSLAEVYLKPTNQVFKRNRKLSHFDLYNKQWLFLWLSF